MTSVSFSLPFSIHGNSMLEKSSELKHDMQTIINRWKRSKNALDAGILLEIVLQMEHEVENGWSIVTGIPFKDNLVPGMILWHAHVPIEQLAISIDIGT